MTKLNIGVCYLSVGDEYRKLTKDSKINKELYCEKHGYAFIEENGEGKLIPSNGIPWMKLPLIFYNLFKYDYIFYTDADSLIMNSETTIESLIDENYDMIIASDWIMPNTGQMIIKNSSFCKDFLMAAYSNTDYNTTEHTNGRYGNYEQGSIIALYDKNFADCKSKIKIVEPHIMNSYWFNYMPGNMIFHFACVKGDTLLGMIREFYPNRLPEDDDDTYNKRMLWLSSGEASAHLGRIRQNRHDALKPPPLSRIHDDCYP